jgi:ribonucleoside-diphosphate reductase alpha chain
VPWSILEAPVEIQAAFLQGLFDADGCARDGGDKGRYVGLGSRSKDLVTTVQRLLASLGIASRIYLDGSRRESRFRYTRKDGVEVAYESSTPAYDLRITSRAMAEYARLIGFSLPAKAGALTTMLENGQYEVDTTVRLIDLVEDGLELTYNLTEPRNHSYVVNGLVVANCSEFVFVDDTACNLLSLNLMKFQDEDGGFDVERFRRTSASRPRRSWSPTPPTRPRPSPRTPRPCGPWASATPTWARS